jgi:hypothetical protein
MKRALVLVLGSLAAAAALPSRAEAFCGFYIDGAGKDMFNDATQVVLMRQGTRTVLSMQNTYQGPVEDFAMVVPVPVVLKEGDVKVLEADIFEKVDVMGSPRLVEYWEEDPCAQENIISYGAYGVGSGGGYGYGSARAYGVTVEEQFDVGEYQVVILSATESTGLERWLKAEKYRIPDKAEALLRPYVEAGSKFFVAKVDKDKVTFEGGRAMLSPLRFHYDSESFELPIRLGLANSSGKQDLIVNILSDRRYEVANYKNVTIPTNIDVEDAVRKRFGEFYAALFDRTLEKNPGAVVTEYAWDASSCDPCPGPTLEYDDFVTLGADVAGDGGGSFVLTRLHARYGAKDMKDDLVFKEARPLVGGREQYDDKGKLEQRSRVDDDDVNNFQARYAIRHKWKGKIECKSPVRGVWGENPDGDGDEGTRTATKLAFVERGKLKLGSYVRQNIPEIGIKKARKPKKAKPRPK